jgi:hypothetical protein
MPSYLLHHHHEPDECGAAFASFHGFQTPLRHRAAVTSCLYGGHSIWWTVEATGVDDARALLPYFVAERATVIPVTEVSIP